MKINGWEVKVVCANTEDNKSIYEDIYDNIEECYREHAKDNIIIGFYLKPEDDRIVSPDWFWNIESAIEYANSNYGGWNKKVLSYPVIKSDISIIGETISNKSLDINSLSEDLLEQAYQKRRMMYLENTAKERVAWLLSDIEYGHIEDIPKAIFGDIAKDFLEHQKANVEDRLTWICTVECFFKRIDKEKYVKSHYPEFADYYLKIQKAMEKRDAMCDQMNPF